MQEVVKKLIRHLGEPYSSQIGINLESKKESEIFKWFLASILLPSPLIKMVAKNLGIDLNNFNKHTKSFVKLECALLRLGKNYCRKNKCNDCEFKIECKKN